MAGLSFMLSFMGALIAVFVCGLQLLLDRFQRIRQPRLG